MKIKLLLSFLLLLSVHAYSSEMLDVNSLRTKIEDLKSLRLPRHSEDQLIIKMDKILESSSTSRITVSMFVGRVADSGITRNQNYDRDRQAQDIIKSIAQDYISMIQARELACAIKPALFGIPLRD